MFWSYSTHISKPAKIYQTFAWAARCWVALATRKCCSWDLCLFSRKHFCYNLGTTNDSLMDAFLEMGLSITENLVTAMTKWSTAMKHFIAVQAKCRGNLRIAELTWWISWTTFRKTRHSGPRLALKIAFNIQISEPVPVVWGSFCDTNRWFEGLYSVFNEVSGTNITRLFFHPNISCNKNFNIPATKLKFSASTKFSAENPKFLTFNIRVLTLGARFFNPDSHLKFSGLILITCRAPKSQRRFLMSVFILFT